MKILGKEISTAFVLFLIGLIILCGVVVYAVASTLTLPMDGEIITPANVIASATYLHFGTIINGTGTPVEQHFSLTNNGQVPTEQLTIQYTLTPDNVGTLTWDSDGAIIHPDQTIQVTVTFHPAANPPIGDWHGDLVITYAS